MRPVTRVEPVGPASAYKTYGVSFPEESHFREASCSEVECGMQRDGWISAFDESTDLGQQQALYIRRKAGRRFTESRDAGRTLFTFPPGEECFRTHQVKLDREGIHIVRDGDWRGNPTGRIVVHDRPEFWQEDFAEHQNRISDALNR